MTWKCYVKDSVSYAAMTDETQALAYRIEWTMNHPATVEVLVNDDSGAKTQTYGTGYLGTSALLLEQPAATEIFRGRIVGVEPNPHDGVVKLFAEDWLSQLNDRLVIYDTRENLGNSYREFPAGRPHHTPYAYQTGWDHDGANHILVLDAHQELGGWSNDQWNGYRLVLPSGRHMSAQTDRLLAYDETTWSDSLPLTTDTPADGEQNTWLVDGSYHSVTDTVTHNLTVDYTFRSLVDTSALIDSIDSIDVTAVCRAYGAGLNNFYMMLDYGPGAFYDTLYSTTSGAMDHLKKITGSANEAALDNYFNGGGDLTVEFYCYSSAGGVVSLDVDQIYVDVGYTVDTALTTTYNISDTVHEHLVNRDTLYLTGDPITDGAVSGWPFSITRVATVYVADLVTTYDELYALNASHDVTASTNYIARHYHRQTPLQILRDFAAVDGTQFWLDKWDGDSLDLHWNDAFGGAAVATWSDASVLGWTPSGYRLKDVINEAFVEGYTHGDTKVQATYSHAASIASYGQRSRYVQNPDIGRNDEALTEATNIVTRQKDPNLLLTGILNGYSTVNLGDIITVNSAKFNINTDYVVTRKLYDSQSATSTFDLAPKTTLLTVRPPLSQFLTRLDDRITQLETQTERPARYTDLWS